MACCRILTKIPYLHMRGSKVRIAEDDAQAAQVKPNGTKPPAALSHWAISGLHGIPTCRDAHANTLKVRALTVYELQTWFACPSGPPAERAGRRTWATHLDRARILSSLLGL
jgi:hypothetical protein